MQTIAKLCLKLSGIPNNPPVDQFTIIRTHMKSDIDAQGFIEYIFKKTIDWTYIEEIVLKEKIFVDNTEHTLVLKNSKTQHNYKIKIDEINYSYLLTFPQIGVISKLRSTNISPDTKLIIKLDNYYGKLEGLYIAEIKYDRNNYSDGNTIIQNIKRMFGDNIIDITYDPQYRDSFLAAKLCL